VIDDVVDEEPNPLRQRELIDLWKQELNRCYEGVTIVPLLKELKESIDRFQIPQEYFLKLIEGCEMDINKKRYETFEELYQYCYRVASMVGLVCMKIFEYKSSTSEEAAINLGIALQLTNIIRDVGVDLDKGRIYLPLEDLKTFNISEADLRSKDDSEKFKALMDFEYKRAMTYYEKGTLEFKKDPTNRLLAAKIMAVVYSRILKKIKKKNFPVLHRRIGLKFYQKLAILAQLLIFS
jgi:phytoene synthase